MCNKYKTNDVFKQHWMLGKYYELWDRENRIQKCTYSMGPVNTHTYTPIEKIYICILIFCGSYH